MWHWAQAHRAVRLLTWHLQPLSFLIPSSPHPPPKDELNRHHTSFYFILSDKQNVSLQKICIYSCNTLDFDWLWYLGGFLWRGQIPVCVIERKWWTLSKGWLIFILWLKIPDQYHSQKLEQLWGEGQELRAKGELGQSRRSAQWQHAGLLMGGTLGMLLPLETSDSFQRHLLVLQVPTESEATSRAESTENLSTASKHKGL